MPFGYAYTDSKKNVLLGIYQNVRTGLPGYQIPGWFAYDNRGRAIGLDPAKMYRFVKKQKTTPRFNLEQLPENSVITRSRSQLNWSEVQIDSKNAKECTGLIRFREKPLYVFLNGKNAKINGSELKFQASYPVSLIAVYKDDSLPVDRKAMQTKNWTYGYENVNGLPASVGYRSYYFNMGGGMSRFRFAGAQKHTLSLGCGLHGQYASRLAKIPAGTKSLRFSLALKNSLKNVPMEFSVQLNGVDVFRKTMENTEKWEDCKADISAYAGQTALLTFQFRYADPAQRVDRNVNNILRIADIDFE